MKVFDRDLLLVHYGALGLAFVCWQLLKSNGTAIAAGSAVLVACVMEATVFAFVRSSKRRSEKMEEELRQINAVSIEEARRRAITHLERSHETTSGVVLPDGLTESQQEFFRRFDGARFGDGTALTLKDFRPSEWIPGFVVIGGNGSNEVITRLGDDRVCEIEGPATEDELSREYFASIWHYFLASSGDDWKTSA